MIKWLVFATIACQSAVLNHSASASAHGNGSIAISISSSGDGSPVLGANVRLLAAKGKRRMLVGDFYSSRVGRVGRSDGKGLVQFEGLVPGAYAILIENRLDSRILRGVSIRGGEGLRYDVELRTRSDRKLEGTIIDDQGLPVIGAIIRTVDVDVLAGVSKSHFDPAPLSHSAADDSGRFRLSWPSWRSILAVVEAPGFSTRVVRLVDEASHVSVVLPRVSTLSFSLPGMLGDKWRGGVSVVVRVDQFYRHDVHPGLEVDLEWHTYSLEEEEVSIGGLPSRTPLEIVFSGGGHFLGVMRDVVLLPGEDREISAPRFRYGSLKVEVRDLEGNLLPGINVRCSYVPDGRQRTPGGRRVLSSRTCKVSGETEQDGVARFGILPLGTWEVQVASDRQGWDPFSSEDFVSRRTELELGVPSAMASMTLVAHKGLSVSGTVLREDGTPVRGAMIIGALGDNGFGAKTESDESGNFRLGPLVPGDYEVRAFGLGLGFGSASDPVNCDPSGKVTLVLPSRSGMRVWLSLNGQEPSGRSEIIVSRSGDFVSRSVHPIRGRFIVGGLEDGHYGFFARHDAFVGGVAEVKVNKPSAIGEVAIPLVASGTLSVFMSMECPPTLMIVKDDLGCVVEQAFVLGGMLVDVSVVPGLGIVEFWSVDGDVLHESLEFRVSAKKTTRLQPRF